MNHQKKYDVKPLARRPSFPARGPCTVTLLLKTTTSILAINFLLKVTILVKYQPFEEKGFYASVKYVH